MVGRVAVAAGGDDFAADVAANLSDLFGSFVNKQDDQINLGVVVRDGGGEVLEQHGLTCARRGDDQSTLALANGREQVHDAGGQRLWPSVQADAFAGVDGCELLELARHIARWVGLLNLLDAG